MHGFFGFAFMLMLVGLAIAAGLVYALVRLFSPAGEQQGSREEDARIIQELYQGLSRMEERVESLETILMDQDSRRKAKDGEQ